AFERVPRLTRGPSPSRAMDSSADFPRAEKRRRHCWRERVGNAGASFVWRRLPLPAIRRSHPINGLLYAGEKRASEWTNSGIEAARMTHSGVGRGEERSIRIGRSSAGKEGNEIGRERA